MLAIRCHDHIHGGPVRFTERITVIDYSTTMAFATSDHKPVRCGFSIRGTRHPTRTPEDPRKGGGEPEDAMMMAFTKLKAFARLGLDSDRCPQAALRVYDATVHAAARVLSRVALLGALLSAACSSARYLLWSGHVSVVWPSSLPAAGPRDCPG